MSDWRDAIMTHTEMGDLIDTLRAETVEQARLLGMSAEREARLMAEVERLRAEIEQLRAYRELCAELFWSEPKNG